MDGMSSRSAAAMGAATSTTLNTAPVVDDGGDLFGLGTGYTYYVDPAQWVYPARIVVKLPRDTYGDLQLLARSPHEQSPRRGSLILRVNGREQSALASVVSDGDVVEVDAQANDIDDDVRVVVVRYMWRDPGG